MSKYIIKLDLPQGWEKEESTYIEVDGTEVTHIECHLPDDAAQKDIAIIDLYSGQMPSDTTASDEALANYADIVGFDGLHATYRCKDHPHEEYRWNE